MLPTGMPTAEPSPSPSSTPTFDTRPTLEIVQERGHLLCGVGDQGSGLDASVVNFTDLVSYFFSIYEICEFATTKLIATHMLGTFLVSSDFRCTFR
jgi:hypothetical protein